MNLLPLYEELNINRFGVRLPKRYGRYSDVTCNMPPRVRDPRRALVNSLPAALKPCTEGSQDEEAASTWGGEEDVNNEGGDEDGDNGGSDEDVNDESSYQYVYSK